MAVTLAATHSGAQYPWGYELRIDLTDGTRLYHRAAVWPTEPSSAQIDEAVATVIVQLEALLNPPEPERHYRIICEDDAEVLL
jgi:hypothetical protein